MHFNTQKIFYYNILTLEHSRFYILVDISNYFKKDTKVIIRTEKM